LQIVIYNILKIFGNKDFRKDKTETGNFERRCILCELRIFGLAQNDADNRGKQAIAFPDNLGDGPAKFQQKESENTENSEKHRKIRNPKIN